MPPHVTTLPARPLAPALLLLLAACAGSPAPSPGADPEPPPAPERVILRAGDVTGLSALAIHPDGTLWTAPERDRVLLEVGDGGAVQRWPLAGIPRGLDLESAAWIDSERLALGTESSLLPSGTPREGGDPIFVVRRTADRFEVSATIVVDYALWDMQVNSNEGIEGMCTAGGALYLGIETVADRSGSRRAPLARLDPDTGTFTPYLLALTSTTGSLSALACRERDGVIEAIAVERHFGVSRLLSFTLPAEGGVIEPVVLYDLADFIAQTRVNIEGIELDGDDILLVVDNHYKAVTGPNELLVLER